MTTTLNTSCFENITVLSVRRGFQHACIFPEATFRPLSRGDGTNSARLFTPAQRKALAKSKVHQ
jgi:hypothetical protein